MTGFPDLPGDLTPDEKKQWERALWDAKLKRIDSLNSAEQAIDAEFYKSVFAVAQGSIDRARAGADTVQKAAAGIAALYPTLLAVAFSVKDHPLPSRGLIPMVFLGVAIVSSTAYLAYLTRARPVSVLTPGGSAFQRNVGRVRSFIEWTRAAAEHQAYLLRLSVVALGLGVAFLPAPFVSFEKTGSVNADAATTVTTPDWPSPSPNAGSNASLQKVVYAAQVSEVAEARKAASSTAPVDTGENRMWWLVAAGAAVLMLLAPGIINAFVGGTQAEEGEAAGR